MRDLFISQCAGNVEFTLWRTEAQKLLADEVVARVMSRLVRASGHSSNVVSEAGHSLLNPAPVLDSTYRGYTCIFVGLYHHANVNLQSTGVKIHFNLEFSHSLISQCLKSDCCCRLPWSSYVLNIKSLVNKTLGEGKADIFELCNNTDWLKSVRATTAFYWFVLYTLSRHISDLLHRYQR